MKIGTFTLIGMIRDDEFANETRVVVLDSGGR
jgi:hypothetical protein